MKKLILLCSILSNFCLGQKTQLGIVSADSNYADQRPKSPLHKIIFKGGEMYVLPSSGSTYKMQRRLSFASPFIQSGTNISFAVASTSTNGYLTSTDWNTFNNKGSFTLPSLTSGSVLFSNGTTISQNNSNFFWDNTNLRLGIGKNNPAQTIDANGVIMGTTLRAGTSTLNTSLFNYFGTAPRLATSGNTLDFFANQSFWWFTSGDIQRMLLTTTGLKLFGSGSPTEALDVAGNTKVSGSAYFATTSGNVGIGTVAPFHKFHVYGNIVSNEGNKIGFRYSGGDENTYSYITGGGSNVFAFVNNYTGSTTAKMFSFTTGNGEVLTVLGGGNVGINKTSPNSKLAVSGLPVYADNTTALAGGLTAGDFYRTSIGILMVVY